ncbi:MAG: DUF1800 domain-containing protein [Vicinamibacterales bacterium]|nr:DUF1800 domain-containing protein [Vicinamibacterales bacterium]
MAFPDLEMMHVLRRAAFGARPEELADFSKRGLAETIDEFINFTRVADDVDDKIGTPGYVGTTSNGAFSPSTVINDARQRWLFRMVHSRRPLQEKMALFWHNHFATAYSKVSGNTNALDGTRMMAAKRSEHPGKLQGQLELFREYALGNFRDMLVEVAKDPAMLVWLDGRTNTRRQPQENFGREIMELFTMGVGFYTEPDVYAAARVFTGWNLQRVGSGDDTNGYYQFQYIANNHETTAKDFSFSIYADGSKTIPARSAANGMQDGLDLIEALARHPETGRRLARKLWNFFVSETNQPDEFLIRRLASTYQTSGFSMAAVMQMLLTSRDFLSPANHFTKYSWPAEFVVKSLKEVGHAGFSVNTALTPLANMGQQLFEPPDVAGWDLGRNWFSTGAMLARMNFAATLTANQRFNISEGARGKGPTPEALLTMYLEQLSPATYDRAAYNDLLDYLRTGGTWTGNDAQIGIKAPGLLHLIVGSSEYQFV